MGTKLEPGQFDCWGHAAPDEPVFTLVARDPSAPACVELWAYRRALAITRGEKSGEDWPKVHEALQCADAMRAWCAKHSRLGALERSSNFYLAQQLVRRHAPEGSAG